MLSLVKNYVTTKIPEIRVINSEFPFFIYPKIIGDGLDCKKYQSLGEVQRDILAKDLAGFFSQIHEVPVSKATEYGAKKRQMYVGLQELEEKHKGKHGSEMDAFIDGALKNYMEITSQHIEPSTVFGYFTFMVIILRIIIMKESYLAFLILQKRA